MLVLLGYFGQQSSPPVRWHFTLIKNLIADIQKLAQGNWRAGFKHFCTNVIHTRCFAVLQPRDYFSQFLDCKGASVHLDGIFAVTKLTPFRKITFFTRYIQDLIKMLFPPFKYFFLCGDDFTLFRPYSSTWLLKAPA